MFYLILQLNSELTRTYIVKMSKNRLHFLMTLFFRTMVNISECKS